MKKRGRRRIEIPEEELANYYNKLTLAEIAKLYEVSIGTIYNRFKEMERRNRNQADQTSHTSHSIVDEGRGENREEKEEGNA